MFNIGLFLYIKYKISQHVLKLMVMPFIIENIIISKTLGLFYKNQI